MASERRASFPLLQAGGAGIAKDSEEAKHSPLLTAHFPPEAGEGKASASDGV